MQLASHSRVYLFFPFHIHIQLAALRLIQHLFQALLLCFFAFRG